jgi:nucleotide-binding universal stress UspA family protein
MTAGLPVPEPALEEAPPAPFGTPQPTTDGYVGRPVPQTRGAAIALGFGVGGAGTSALLWAVEEAERTGRELRLVSSTDQPVSPLHHSNWRRDVTALIRQLAIPGLGYRLGSGPAADVLLEAATDASLLVVGRQGGQMGRRGVGGTAAALAEQSPVPLVVVPQQWSQSSTFNAPVLVSWMAMADVGPDGMASVDGAMWFALERATRYRVPLLIVSADSTGAEMDSDDGARRLDGLRRSSPAIEIVRRSFSGSIEAALEAMSAGSQLVVVSRPAARSRNEPDGVVDHLLRRSNAPVAILPPLP